MVNSYKYLCSTAIYVCIWPCNNIDQLPIQVSENTHPILLFLDASCFPPVPLHPTLTLLYWWVNKKCMHVISMFWYAWNRPDTFSSLINSNISHIFAILGYFCFIFRACRVLLLPSGYQTMYIYTMQCLEHVLQPRSLFILSIFSHFYWFY